MNDYIYVYNCTCPDNIDELEYIIDNCNDITLEEFKQAVNIESFNNLLIELGYDKDFKIENDWHVSYYITKYKGQVIYHLQHSCIEYIFKND